MAWCGYRRDYRRPNWNENKPLKNPMRKYEHAKNEVRNGGILVFEPLSEGVAPAFTHTACLSGLEATSSSALKARSITTHFYKVSALTPVIRLVVP